MQSKAFSLVRYDADEGKVFDWADLTEHQTEDENGEVIQEHLYAKFLFLGTFDTIDNYILVDAPKEGRE